MNRGYVQILRPEKATWVITSILNEGSIIGLDSALSGFTVDLKMCAPIKTDMWFIETYELKSVLDFYDDETVQLKKDARELTEMENKCWKSETVLVNEVSVKKLVLVDKVLTLVSELPEHMLAGAAILAEKGEKKGVVSGGLIKTITVDPENPLMEIER